MFRLSAKSRPGVIFLSLLLLPARNNFPQQPAAQTSGQPQEEHRLRQAAASALSTLGIFYYQNQAYEQAAATLEDALSYDPDNENFRTNLAMIYLQQGRFEKVIGTLDSAYKMAQPDQRSLTALAVAYFATGKYDRAIPYYKKLTEILPQDPVLRLTLAAVYELSGDSENSRKALKELPDNDKTRAQYHVLLADAHRNQLRVPEAVAEYEQAISLDPTLPDVNYRLGVLYSDLNRIEKAAEAFQRELKINPESASANYSLGAYYLNYRNNAEQARQYFERSLKLNPTLLEPYLGLMKIELSQGRPNVAIDLAQKVEAAGQDNEEYHYLKSRAFNLLGKKDLAERELNIFEELKAGKK